MITPSRPLTKAERSELRHHLQELSENAKSVRNAVEPETGVHTVTAQAWDDQWAALTRNLDAITQQIRMRK